MFRFLLYFFLLFAAFQLHSQPTTYKWALKGNQSADDCTVQAIDTDPQGNTYILVSLRSTVSFGALSVVSIHNHTQAVVKIDTLGAPVWMAVFGGNSPNTGNDILVDDFGNIYVCGNYTNSISFGSTTLNFSGSNPGNDRSEFFLARLSPAGQWEWAVKQTGDAHSDARGLAADGAGNVYIGGNFSRATLQLGTQSIEMGEENLPFVARYSNTGQAVWIRTASTLFGASLSAITYSNGVVYIAGATGTFEIESIEIQFGDFTLTNEGYEDDERALTTADIYVAALNTSGNYLWARNAGSIFYEASVSALEADVTGRIYVAGLFQDELNAGNLHIEAAGEEGDFDLYVAAIDMEGNWSWLNGTGNESPGAAPGLTRSGDNIYMHGAIGEEPLAFGDTTLAADDQQTHYIVYITPSGNWLWALSIPPANDVSAVSAHTFRVAGNFTGTLGLGEHTLTASGQQDIYVTSIDHGSAPHTRATSPGSENEIKTYPQPFSTILYIDAEKADRAILQDAGGRIVQTEQLRSQPGTITLNISQDLAPGIYFLQVYSGNNIRQAKVIKL